MNLNLDGWERQNLQLKIYSFFHLIIRLPRTHKKRNADNNYPFVHLFTSERLILLGDRLHSSAIMWPSFTHHNLVHSDTSINAAKFTFWTQPLLLGSACFLQERTVERGFCWRRRNFAQNIPVGSKKCTRFVFSTVANTPSGNLISYYLLSGLSILMATIFV